MGPNPPRNPHLVLWLTIAVALPRLLLFPWNENLYGDAVVRTELARAWLESPHWISSFVDGARQFGPLHLYLIAGALRLWPSAEHAGRLVSLLLGVASVWPLFALTRSAFGERAAAWACLGFAAWGLHVQMSTTAGSEALSVFLLLCTAAFYRRAHAEGDVPSLLLSALFLNLGCATRYDAWMLIPLLWAGFFAGSAHPRKALGRAMAFGLASLPFPLLWLWGNQQALGHPLAPMHYIDWFHHRWVADNIVRYGPWGARLQALFFWPGTALLSLSPILGLSGMVGLARGYRRRPDLRWLFWLVIAPTVYFAGRGALLSFVPLARFTVGQLALLLPWAFEGAAALTACRPAWRSGLTAAAAALAVLFPLALGAATFRDGGHPWDALRPLSPVSRNPPALIAAARAVGRLVEKAPGTVLLDQDPAYSDVQLAFFSGLPESRWIRRRWPDQRMRREMSPPEFVLLLPSGQLLRDDDVKQRLDGLEVAGLRYVESPTVAPPFRLFRRAR